MGWLPSCMLCVICVSVATQVCMYVCLYTLCGSCSYLIACVVCGYAVHTGCLRDAGDKMHKTCRITNLDWIFWGLPPPPEHVVRGRTQHRHRHLHATYTHLHTTHTHLLSLPCGCSRFYAPSPPLTLSDPLTRIHPSHCTPSDAVPHRTSVSVCCLSARRSTCTTG